MFAWPEYAALAAISVVVTYAVYALGVLVAETVGA